MSKQFGNKKAFTIIELMLAMSFLATMLLGIASLVIRITNIYQKGLSMRAINTTGREMISDLGRTIGSSATTLKINPMPDANGNISVSAVEEKMKEYYYQETVSDDSAKQTSGTFCTGRYSYIWNTPESLKTDSSNREVGRIGYRNKANDVVYPRFARIPDTERLACKIDDYIIDADSVENIGRDSVNNGYIIADSDPYFNESDVYSIVRKDETNLAVYDFTLTPAIQNEDTGEIFYSGSFIIATLRGGVNIMSNGDFCTGTKEDTSDDSEFSKNDFEYCAVNKFNFSARATGDSSQKGDRR